MNPGSENQTPGSSLRHGSAETPPSTIGISTEDPVRLSVMVIDSGMGPLQWSERGMPARQCAALEWYLGRESVRSGVKAVHVGLPYLEAQPAVQAVGGLPRRTGGQLDRLGAGAL